jgi:hypothetical protein
LIWFFNWCVLGVDVVLVFLVGLNLSVPECLFLVVLGVPGGPKAVDDLVPGSVQSYHGQDENVEGFVAKVRAFCEVQIGFCCMGGCWGGGCRLCVLVHSLCGVGKQS